MNETPMHRLFFALAVVALVFVGCALFQGDPPEFVTRADFDAKGAVIEHDFAELRDELSECTRLRDALGGELSALRGQVDVLQRNVESTKGDVALIPVDDLRELLSCVEVPTACQDPTLILPAPRYHQTIIFSDPEDDELPQARRWSRRRE